MVDEVAEDIFLIRVPLSMAGLKEVNTYLVRGGDRSLLIDTGFNHPRCLQALLSGLDELGVPLENLEVLATHLHPDHSGLLGWFAEAGVSTYAHIVSGEPTMSEEAAGWQLFFSEAGPNIVDMGLDHEAGDDRPDLLNQVNEEDVVAVGKYRFLCMETPGHHYSQICLYDPDEKVIVSGDHVLMGISPAVSCITPEQNPLREYLESLSRVGSLDAELVLPGHRQVFSNLSSRVNELVAHHEKRLAIVREAIDAGRRTVSAVSEAISWRGNTRQRAQRCLIYGETLAHVSYLMGRGDIDVDVGMRIFNSAKGCVR